MACFVIVCGTLLGVSVFSIWCSELLIMSCLYSLSVRIVM